MNPRKGYRENVAEQERRMIELEHKLEVATRQRDELAEALAGLVKINEEHNEAVSQIIKRPLGWKDSYLDAARKALATKEGGV